MDTKSSLLSLLELCCLVLLFGHITLAACPDNGTPVLQMCTSNTLTVFGTYIDSRGMTTGLLKCHCSVVSDTQQDITVTSVTSPTSPDCTYQDVFSENPITGNTGNWTCDNIDGFPGVLEPIKKYSKLSFALKKRNPNDNSTDSGYCILLTAQSMITVICGENVTTVAPTTATTIPPPTRFNHTVNVMPFPSRQTTTTITPATTSTSTTSTSTSTTLTSTSSSTLVSTSTSLPVTSMSFTTPIASTSVSTPTSTSSTDTSSIVPSSTETTKLSSKIVTVQVFPFISKRVTTSASSSPTGTSELTTDTPSSMSSTLLVNGQSTSRTSGTVDHRISSAPSVYETSTIDDLAPSINTETYSSVGMITNTETYSSVGMITNTETYSSVGMINNTATDIAKTNSISKHFISSSKSISSSSTETAQLSGHSKLPTDITQQLASNITKAIKDVSTSSTTDATIKGILSASPVMMTNGEQTMSPNLSTDSLKPKTYQFGRLLSTERIFPQETTTHDQLETSTMESFTDISISTYSDEQTTSISEELTPTLPHFIPDLHASSAETTMDVVFTGTLSTFLDSTFALELYSTLDATSQITSSATLITEAQLTSHSLLTSVEPTLNLIQQPTTLLDSSKSDTSISSSYRSPQLSTTDIARESMFKTTSSISSPSSTTETVSTITEDLACTSSSLVSNEVTGNGLSSTASAALSSVSSPVATTEVNGNSSFVSTESNTQSKSTSFTQTVLVSNPTDTSLTDGLRKTSSASVHKTSSASHGLSPSTETNLTID